ncbi:MAG: AI-2E family transporter [Cytophagales bacterium]
MLSKYRLLFYLFLILAVLLLVVSLGYVFSNILAYFIVSIILATILRPLVDRLSSLQIYRVKFPRVGAILISFIFLGIVIYLLLELFVPLLSNEISKLYKLDFDTILTNLAGSLTGIENFLISNNIVNEKHGFILEKSKIYFFEYVQNTEFSTLINNTFSVIGSFLIGLLAIFFITFFFLYEKGILRGLFLKLIPNAYFELTVTAFYKIERLLSNYLIGLLFQMIAFFTLVSILLTIAGIKYAFTIAFFAAAANLIPYLGPVLGASFGIIVALTTSGFGMDFQHYILIIIKVLISFGIVQLADNLIFQPIIFSRSVKAHPLEIFVIVFVGATLAGPIGMIFAIPTYTILRVSVIEFYLGYQEYRIFNINQSN